MPEAVCCVVWFDGQLDTSTLCITRFNWKIIACWGAFASEDSTTAACLGPCFSCFSCFSRFSCFSFLPSLNVDHRAAVQCVVVQWKWMYSVTSNTGWWFHDDGYCLQSWEVVSFPPPQPWSWVIIGKLLRLLSVVLSLSLRRVRDKASVVVLFSRRSPLRM